MKNAIRIIAVVGAVALVVALGVTAFASSSNGPSTAPAATTLSRSDDPTPEPAGTPSQDNGEVGKSGDGKVGNQDDDQIENNDDGDVEDHGDDLSGNDDEGRSGNDGGGDIQGDD
jgi:hypothetical protein